jgi:hypothetical protein
VGYVHRRDPHLLEGRQASVVVRRVCKLFCWLLSYKDLLHVPVLPALEVRCWFDRDMPAPEQVLGQGPHGAEPWIPMPHSTRIEQVPLLVRLALLVLQDENPAGGGALQRWVLQHRELSSPATIAAKEEVMPKQQVKAGP